MDKKLLPLYIYSIKVCSKKDIPEKILKDKVNKKFSNKFSNLDISYVFDVLKKENYINDERFTENFINWRKCYMPRGKSLIYNELLQKKVSSKVIDKLINILITEKDEYEMCMNLANKKYLMLEDLNIEIGIKKEKLLKFLMNKKFSYNISLFSVNKLFK